MGQIPCVKKKNENTDEHHQAKQLIVRPQIDDQFARNTSQRNSVTSVVSDPMNAQQQLQHQQQIPQQESEQESAEEEMGIKVEYIFGELIQQDSNVHSALNINNGQLLAIKVVLCHALLQFHMSGEDDLQFAEDRVDILTRLDHPNIHQIIGLDYIKLKQQLFVLMPYESGGSISWLLQKFSKFSPYLAGLFMKQILQGLEYLHMNSVFHQNLKTSNVLVDEDANAKLSDINILNRHSVSIYSAPELFEDGEYTEYSDVWSAGCIFMEMLTRHNPWYYENSDITLPEIRQRLQQGKLFQLKQIITNPQILWILQLIFKQQPHERLTPTQLLEQDFFKNLQIDQAQQSQLISTRNNVMASKKQFKKSKSIKALNSQFSHSGKSLNNHNSQLLSHRSSQSQLRSSNQQQQERLNALLLMASNHDINDIPHTGGMAADGSNKSFSHVDLQTVVSRKSRAYQEKLGVGLDMQDQQNRLLSDGFIRQKDVKEGKVGTNGKNNNNNLIAQQLVGKNNNNMLNMFEKKEQQSQKPPICNNSQYKSYQSKLTNSIVIETKVNDKYFDDLMAQQFYDSDDNESVHKEEPQNLEDMIMQQFYEGYHEQSKEQQPQEVPISMHSPLAIVEFDKIAEQSVSCKEIQPTYVEQFHFMQQDLDDDFIVYL